MIIDDTTRDLIVANAECVGNRIHEIKKDFPDSYKDVQDLLSIIDRHFK